MELSISNWVSSRVLEPSDALAYNTMVWFSTGLLVEKPRNSLTVVRRKTRCPDGRRSDGSLPVFAHAHTPAVDTPHIFATSPMRMNSFMFRMSEHFCRDLQVMVVNVNKNNPQSRAFGVSYTNNNGR